jgi:integrase
MLIAPSKVQNTEHYPAVPISRMGHFMADLRKVKGASARCLELAALTATRSAEARLAKWSEFSSLDDPEQAVWVVPAERMKAKKEHRIPLSAAAVDLVNALPRTEGVDHLFTNTKGKPLSDMAMVALMRRLGAKDSSGKVCVPHGLRSSFRDWAAEHTNFPNELCEMALAHAIPNQVEAAYRRGDMLAKRRELMQHWANFCAIVQEPSTRAPIPINRRAAKRTA